MSMSTKQRNLLGQMTDCRRIFERSGWTALEKVRNEKARVAEIEADWRIPPSQKADGVREARAKTADALQEIFVEQLIAKREYDEILHLMRRAPAEYGNFGVADRQAAWARTRDRLDGLDEKASKRQVAMDLLRDAEKVDDRATLQAAYMELPAYLETRNEVITDDDLNWLALVGGPDAAVEAVELHERHAKSNVRDQLRFGLLYSGHRNGNIPETVPGRKEGTVVATFGVDPTLTRNDPAYIELPVGVTFEGS
jgi:hypothetical protein